MRRTENPEIQVRILLFPQIEREVVQLAERVLWEHEVAGSTPVFPTDVEISVKVNTVASLQERLAQKSTGLLPGH